MYIFYCVFMSFVMSLIYEFSGLNGIKPANVFLSFLLFMLINLIITNPNVRYKRRITIFYFIVTVLAICNAAKVRFQLAEISFFDVKLAKAAGDIAGLFLDKIPYTQIGIILVTFIVVFIFSMKYTLIFDNYKFSKETYEQCEIDERWEQVDGFFSPIFVRIIALLFLIAFFIFTASISKVMSTSSFGNLLISGKSMAENYYLETFPLNYEGHIIRKNCGFGEIAIAANGDVFWCNRIHELTSRWNIRTSKFEDILSASDKIKLTTDVEHSSACMKCDIKYICGGDCRMNYEGISDADSHEGVWTNTCPKGTKENIYRKMVLSNEYFYVDLDEE